MHMYEKFIPLAIKLMSMKERIQYRYAALKGPLSAPAGVLTSELRHWPNFHLEVSQFAQAVGSKKVQSVRHLMNCDDIIVVTSPKCFERLLQAVLRLLDLW